MFFTPGRRHLGFLLRSWAKPLNAMTVQLGQIRRILCQACNLYFGIAEEKDVRQLCILTKSGKID